VYHVLSGSGIVTVEGKDYQVAKGSSVFVPGDAEHGVRNESEEEFRWFYVFATDSFGDVVYRFTGEMEAEPAGDDKSKQGKVDSKAGNKSRRWFRKVKMALGF
jgi:oxalate decarboxylase/phosphoglucose isomerase-like protein (cupin superfamily)